MAKKKPRRFITKSPGLFCGEGDDEFDFISLLKLSYGISGKKPKVENCYGGSSASIAAKAISYSLGRDYKNKALLFDNDHPLSKMSRAQLIEHGFIIIESTQCIEKMWLHMLVQPQDNRLNNLLKRCLTSEDYKQLFHKEFLSGRNRLEQRDLERLFPKPFLEKNRKTNQWLENCINFIESDCATH